MNSTSSRPRAALVFNPVAGTAEGGTAEDLRARLEERWHVEIYETTRERDGEASARAALADGAELVIAAGGDGTVSQVASALLGTGVPLGIIPRGSANSFAAALEIPTNDEEACALLASGTPQELDTASCNGRAMVLFATVGAHAEVIGDTRREAKNRWGNLAYAASALRKLTDLDPFEVELETDGEEIRCRAVAVTVANLVPTHTLVAQGPAEIVGDDALLDVTIVTASTWVEAVRVGAHLLRSALAGEAAEHDDVGYFRCRRVRIVASPPQPLLVDGENAGETPAVVEIRPRTLRVVAPAVSTPVDASIEELAESEARPR